MRSACPAPFRSPALLPCFKRQPARRPEPESPPMKLTVNGDDPRRQRPARHAAALGAARPARPDRHQVRLRHGAVRRLHRAPGRRARALLRARRSRPPPGKKVTTIEGLSAARRVTRCSAPGPSWTWCSAATASPGRSWPRPRCWPRSPTPTDADIDAAHERQHLPLRHLPAHPRRRAPRRRQTE